MRPPICKICGKGFGASGEGDQVFFKLSEEDKEFNKRFEQPGFVGHPAGQEWFCGDHLELAKSFAHLSLQEALPKIMAGSK